MGAGTRISFYTIFPPVEPRPGVREFPGPIGCVLGTHAIHPARLRKSWWDRADQTAGWLGQSPRCPSRIAPSLRLFAVRLPRRPWGSPIAAIVRGMAFVSPRPSRRTSLQLRLNAALRRQRHYPGASKTLPQPPVARTQFWFIRLKRADANHYAISGCAAGFSRHKSGVQWDSRVGPLAIRTIRGLDAPWTQRRWGYPLSCLRREQNLTPFRQAVPVYPR
jgi:hypothetical protein